MNEREASRVANLITERWPTCIQATVNRLAKCDGDEGYSVRIAIPREYRVLRLGRTAQLPGVLDICTTLLGPKAVSFQAVHKTEERRNIMSIDQLQQETETFNEEEAASYLEVKAISVRAYANQGILHRQANGGFLLEELRHYKETRRPRGSAKPTAPESIPTLSEAPSTPVDAEIEDIMPDLALTPESAAPALVDAVCVGVAADIPALAATSVQAPSEEERIIQAVIAHAFASVPGIRGLGRFSEVPRTWKLDVLTARGPESYRLTREPDGHFQQERW